MSTRVRLERPVRGTPAGEGGLAPLLLLAVSIVAGGCATQSVTLPAVVSPLPTVPPGGEGLRAGFGRADITPPPGVGLQGYGPDGEPARGHRHRLYARVLVLEDATGERVALVVADLGQVSLLLQREVAGRVVGETGIGTDRLVLAATHSHAGPGHLFANKTYNDIGGSVRGFDPAMVAFLADRIAEAIRGAVGRLSPAVAGWAEAPLWGSTWNRSYEAYLLNPTGRSGPRPPAGLDPRHGAVNPIWTLLRVDTISASGDTVPAGAFSAFAVHGTGNPASNDLLDGDVHALAQRGLERHIDGLLGERAEFEPRSVHVLANGAVGDVAPGEPGEDTCERLRLRRGRRPGGPRSPPPLDEWYSGDRQPGSPCLREGREITNRVGDAMTDHAVAVFDGARTAVRGDVTIARAFRTVPLTGPEAPPGLCEEAMPGSGMAGGTEDGRTSLHGWRLLGLFPLGAEEGRTDPGGDECQRPKRPVHWAVRLGVGSLDLPRHMQLTVIRIGSMLLAAAPVELTTEAGFRLETAMLGEATRHGLPVRSAAIIGLANGYMQYVSTPEEYEAQHYEGGSTLYGPGTLGVIETQLTGMVGELARGGGASVTPVEVQPGRARSVLPGPGGSAPEAPRLREAWCSADTVVVRWFDARPGTLIPAEGPLLRITRHGAGTRNLSVWDDDRFLEIRALRDGGPRGYVWEARWTPPGGIEGRYTVELLRGPRPANPWIFSCH